MRNLPILLAMAVSAASVSAVSYTDYINSFPTIPVDQRGSLDDFDNDKIPNIKEYLSSDNDPTVADSENFATVTETATEIVYQVDLNPTAEDVSFYIELTNALIGSGAALNEGVVVTANSITATLDKTDPRYDRMLVSLNCTYEGPEPDAGDLVVATTDYPTDNPIATRYGASTYPWTDDLKWDTVVNILDFGGVADGDFATSSGTPNDAALEAAFAALGAAGGVVYFPAGVYAFADHVFLPSNVILRGATPKNADAKTDSYSPPSKLVFPKYNFDKADDGGNGTPRDTAFKSIYPRDVKDAFTFDPETETYGAKPDSITNGSMGVVNLDVNRAGILLDGPIKYPGLGNWSGNVTSAEDLSQLTGTKFVVFGVRSNNTAKPDGAPDINSGVPNSNQEDWQRHPFRFNANIRIAGRGYAIVANCRVNDLSAASEYGWGREVATPGATGLLEGELVTPNYLDDSFEQIGYLVRNPGSNTYLPVNEPGMATFRHADQPGISLNGLFHFNKPTPGAVHGTPETTPWMFDPGHVVRDNYVYAHLQSKIEVSGTELVVANNVMRDDPRKTDWKGSGGTRISSGSSFLSRGCLMGGSDVLTFENDLITTEHQNGNIADLGGGEYAYVLSSIRTNDGEGFMIDNTTTVIRGWKAHRNRMNANVFAFKNKDIKDMSVMNNTWYTGPTGVPQTSQGIPIWIEADRNNDCNWFLMNVRVENNTNLPGTVKMLGSDLDGDGAGMYVGNTFINNKSSGGIEMLQHSTQMNVLILDNEGFMEEPITNSNTCN